MFRSEKVCGLLLVLLQVFLLIMVEKLLLGCWVKQDLLGDDDMEP